MKDGPAEVTHCRQVRALDKREGQPVCCPDCNEPTIDPAAHHRRGCPAALDHTHGQIARQVARESDRRRMAARFYAVLLEGERADGLAIDRAEEAIERAERRKVLAVAMADQLLDELES